MALNLKKTVKGVEAEYWILASILWNKTTGKTDVALNLYKDKASRDESLDNVLFGLGFSFDGYLTQAEIYTAIKQPVPTVKPEHWDEEISGEFIPTETNEFVSAIDC